MRSFFWRVWPLWTRGYMGDGSRGLCGHRGDKFGRELRGRKCTLLGDGIVVVTAMASFQSGHGVLLAGETVG